MDSDPVALPTVISYVRGPHDADIVALAQRLIEHGVPCDLDLFEMRPVGGWSRWMTEKMTGTDIVLVVCSEPYYNRYHLKEEPGVGKGATFEGGCWAGGSWRLKGPSMGSSQLCSIAPT